MVPSRSASEKILTATQVDASGRPTGMKIFTFLTVRSQGTRALIHMHGYGGQTCIASGEMTLFLEGAEPQLAPAGTCYWMPPGLRMAGVNTGNGDAVMFDTFVAPSEREIWTLVETGFQGDQDQFSGAAGHKH